MNYTHTVSLTGLFIKEDGVKQWAKYKQQRKAAWPECTKVSFNVQAATDAR